MAERIQIITQKPAVTTESSRCRMTSPLPKDHHRLLAVVAIPTLSIVSHSPISFLIEVASALRATRTCRPAFSENRAQGGTWSLSATRWVLLRARRPLACGSDTHVPFRGRLGPRCCDCVLPGGLRCWLRISAAADISGSQYMAPRFDFERRALARVKMCCRLAINIKAQEAPAAR